ncbi:MAG: hypothetical protein Phog2KO_45730 [Phototrophicaceae bacterium]
MKLKLLLFIVLLTINLLIIAQEDDSQSYIFSNSEIIMASNVDQLQNIAQFDIEGIIKKLQWIDETHLYIETYSENWILDLASQELLSTDPVNFLDEDIDLYAVTDMEVENDIVVSETIAVFSSHNDDMIIEIPVSLYEQGCDYACSVSTLFNSQYSQLVYTAQVSGIESAFVDLETGQKISLPRNGYFDTSYSYDGSILATFVGDAGYLPRLFYIFDTETGNLLREIQVTGSEFAFDNNDEIIAIGRYDDTAPNSNESIGIVDIYDMNELGNENNIEPLSTVYLGRPPNTIVFSDDNRIIAMSNLTKSH